MTDALRARSVLARGVSLANKAITDVVYVAYPCLLVWLAYAAATGAAGAAGALLRAVLVPGISFVLVTVLRKVINAPLPSSRRIRAAIRSLAGTRSASSS